MSEKYLKSQARNLAEGLGTELCWGWSPAVNFLDVLDAATLEAGGAKPTPSEAGPDGSTVAKLPATLEEVELESGSTEAMMAEMGLLDEEEMKKAKEKQLEKLKKAAQSDSSTSDEEGEPIRVLMCGAADVRHVLRTMAALRSKEAEGKKLRPVHFYLYEPNLRVHCRHLLFLKMICDSSMTFAELEDRVAIFLELYGNSMIRDLTNTYLKQQTSKAIKAWGYAEGPLAKFIDHSEMKGKERDFVEEQMRHWTRDSRQSQQPTNIGTSDTPDTAAAASADATASVSSSTTTGGESNNVPRALTEAAAQASSSGGTGKVSGSGGRLENVNAIKVVGLRQAQAQGSDFPVEAQWDKRVRDEMAERYDNKVNIIDWDFTMQLKDYSTQLKFPEYREWRLTGMGYDYARVNPRKGFLYEYTQPNKTLAHFHNKGFGVYCGDVKNGPFWGLGGSTENTHITKPDFQGMIKVSNGIIAMHNVRAWWYCLLTGSQWPWTDHKFAWDDVKYYNYLPEGTPSDVEHTVSLPDVKFFFVGLSLERLMMHTVGEENPNQSNPATESSSSSSYGDGFFDAAFIGCNSTQFLENPKFFKMMKPEGAVIAETVKFVVDAQKEAKSAFTEKVLEYAGKADWQLNPRKTSVLHKDQVPPHKLEEAKNDGEKEKALKAQTPYQLVLTKKKD